MIKNQKNKKANRKGLWAIEGKSMVGSLPALAAAATRALESKRIKNLKQLSQFSEPEILALHGMGPGSIKQ